MPRFSGENLEENLALVDELKTMAAPLNIAPGQLAFAWLLSKGDHIAPIPGTKRRRFLEENAAAAKISLDPSVIDELESVFAPENVSGARYGQSWMQSHDKDD